jgi:hypothetical protein
MFTYLAAYFVPLLAPANEMSYDTMQFYNAALAIVAGTGAAALSFRLMPPLSPVFRTRRFPGERFVSYGRPGWGHFYWLSIYVKILERVLRDRKANGRNVWHNK